MSGLTEIARLLGLGAVALLIAFHFAGALCKRRSGTVRRPLTDFENHGQE